MNKLTYRPFNEAVHDVNLVSRKDVDIRLIESILLGSRFLPENPQIFQLELLSRFSRAAGANSPVIGRMVAEAALMVLVTSERCIVPFYPCVSPSLAGVRRRTCYGPTHVLAVTTVQLHQPEVEKDAGKDSNNLDTLAVVWGARSGLEVWRYSPVVNTFQYHYRICNQVQHTTLYAF